MEKSFAQRDLFWQEIKENKRKLFSLIYNGAELGSADLACEIKNTQKDKNKEITTLSWSLPESSVKIELQFSIFEDFPYLEYETFITNDSSDKSKIIEEVKMLSLAGSIDSSYYGEMITYLGMTAPMALLALITWLRNPWQDSAEVAVPLSVQDLPS